MNLFRREKAITNVGKGDESYVPYCDGEEEAGTDGKQNSKRPAAAAMHWGPPSTNWGTQETLLSAESSSDPKLSTKSLPITAQVRGVRHDLLRQVDTDPMRAAASLAASEGLDDSNGLDMAMTAPSVGYESMSEGVSGKSMQSSKHSTAQAAGRWMERSSSTHHVTHSSVTSSESSGRGWGWFSDVGSKIVKGLHKVNGSETNKYSQHQEGMTHHLYQSGFKYTRDDGTKSQGRMVTSGRVGNGSGDDASQAAGSVLPSGGGVWALRAKVSELEVEAAAVEDQRCGEEKRVETAHSHLQAAIAQCQEMQRTSASLAAQLKALEG
mmetsp:Transcript_13880/g.18456  ORF Transcript_13880/g.18456 Transcript_13880/m.18456 type:complete len:324 (-) Transcript_13880:189-1160(-)|eukprot:CAMPEP_0185765826 /NCGR_PEP_ID=MMETSP1174-20130828/33080_1 /TAXON_ID=35687 /ORGANISM="Dictyocha speculum, Strain CCMP1381" /LENGTH=323 /DNA_ID=CAMNT_0028449197 /DNA_START=168 /DNA_END=1139 /DNA_ORIENTATION=+